MDCTLDCSESRSEIPGKFEMYCWRRMEKMIHSDRVRNEDVLHKIKEKENILQTVKRRQANWIGHVLRKKCLLKHVVVEKATRTGRRGKRRNQLLDDRKMRGYWKLKGAAVAQWLRCCATKHKVAVSIPAGVIQIFH